MKIIGLDVGGTKIEAALFSGNVTVKKVRQKTEAEKGREAVLKNIINAVRAVFEPGVAAIGVALAGVTDPEKGTMLESPHIRVLVGAPVKRILEKEFNVKVAVDNDARMFALGVQNFYKARNLVTLTLGTGVGGAAIINGRLEKNPRSTKEEMGHTLVRKNGRKCACGARGCLEAYASGWAIAKRYRELSGKKLSAYRKVVHSEAGAKDLRSSARKTAHTPASSRKSSARKTAHTPASSRKSCCRKRQLPLGSLADAKEIAERAKRGDKISKKVIGEARNYLAKALAIIAEKYKPEVIVAGGGAAKMFKGLKIELFDKNAALLGAAMRAKGEVV